MKLNQFRQITSFSRTQFSSIEKQVPVSFLSHRFSSTVSNRRFYHTTPPVMEAGSVAPSQEKSSDWLKGLKNVAFDRGGKSGQGYTLEDWFKGTIPDEFKDMIPPEELAKMKEQQNTPADVEKRMPVRIGDYYLKLAKYSPALRRYVLPFADETNAIRGEIDPSNQKSFEVKPGVYHKYPNPPRVLVVGYCPDTCRNCYVFDVKTGISGKENSKIDEVSAYIRAHNERFRKGEEPFPISEVLLTGGDVGALPYKTLARWIDGMAQSGVDTVRLGTKQIVFHPEYFAHPEFANTLDALRARHPHLRIQIMSHVSHSHELFQLHADGNFVTDTQGKFVIHEPLNRALGVLNSRYPFITTFNQTPIVYKVNDSAEELARLQLGLMKNGITPYYFFVERPILRGKEADTGHDVFAVPVEQCFSMLKESQHYFSGTSQRARLAMSTEIGKLEVSSVGDGLTAFRLIRAPRGKEDSLFGLIVAENNPDALWIDGYKDRIIHDGTGLIAPDKSLSKDKLQKIQGALTEPGYRR